MLLEGSHRPRLSTNGRPREEAEGSGGSASPGRDQQAPAPGCTSSRAKKLPPAPHPTLASWPPPSSRSLQVR